MSVQTPPASTDAPGPQAERKSWFARHKIMTALGVIVLLGIIFGNAGGSDSTSGTDSSYASTDAASDTTASDTSASDTSASDTSASASDDQAPADEAPSEPSYTASQENAIAAAEQYLGTMPFSKHGLIEQLSSKMGSGFPRADAEFAVSHIKVNWNKQAALAAKQYLDTMPMSRSGLIEQLESKMGSGFTHAQAVYGANHAGL